MSTPLLQVSAKKAVEVAVILGAYILFLAVGIFSGQATMSIDILNPHEGTLFRSSPVQLVARVTLRGTPAFNITARFTISAFGSTSQSTVDTVTERNGIAMVLIPVPSGNYTWHVAAIKEGYPTIVSADQSFSINLSLLVDIIQPSYAVVASPVDFQARVTDMNNQPAGSANVTFYVDSMKLGSSLAEPNGIAKLTVHVNNGTHSWFASANKDDEGGISSPPIPFVVGKPLSASTSSLDTIRLETSQANANNPNEQITDQLGITDTKTAVEAIHIFVPLSK